MNVATLLNAKGRDVATLSQERSVRDAIALLKERGVGALVVTGPTPPLVGIISERDVVRALATQGDETLRLSVGELMSHEVSVCTEETDLHELMSTMTNLRIRHVPVVKGDQLVGLVSIGDVVKAVVEELERTTRDLLDYVAAR